MSTDFTLHAKGREDTGKGASRPCVVWPEKYPLLSMAERKIQQC